MGRNQSHHLWYLYQGTYFKGVNRELLGDSFVIITANNPHGALLESQSNIELNLLLQAKLKQLGLSYLRVLAGNFDFSHAEESLVVNCSLKQGVSLATMFNQNAIFSIERDELSLVPCLLSGVEQTVVGSFIERLR
ncbi:MAG: DUF3293 domain-containing protein [Gammaproteobacteria bacterium]|nr:DUF3293 domain-containing protein [Gammaproteobacteria bacterium]